MKQNEKTYKVTVELDEKLYGLYERIPVDLRDKSFQIALAHLWGNEVFFEKFFASDNPYECKQYEKHEFPF